MRPRNPRRVLSGTVLEEQGIHGALEAYVQLGDLPFGQRHDRHIGETHALEEACVLLVAAGPISLRRDQVESCMSSWIPGLISVAPDTARAL